LVDAVGQILKLHGAAILPVVETFAPAMYAFSNPSQPESLQLVAASFIADVIEYGGTLAHKYIVPVVPLLAANVSNPNVDVPLAQCSAYAIAKAFGVAPSAAAALLDSILPVLVAAVQQLPPLSTGSVTCDEDLREGVNQNCVMALVYITSYMPDVLASKAGTSKVYDITEITKLWVQRLPLRSDEQGSTVCTSLLCDAIESDQLSTVVLGGTGCTNIPDIVRVFAESFDAYGKAIAESHKTGVALDAVDTLQFAHSSTITRMQAILRTMSANAGLSAHLQSAFTALNPELQAVLKAVLTQTQQC
jgi:hypothetical protein